VPARHRQVAGADRDAGLLVADEDEELRMERACGADRACIQIGGSGTANRDWIGADHRRVAYHGDERAEAASMGEGEALEEV
jgi:hypothetical protein